MLFCSERLVPGPLPPYGLDVKAFSVVSFMGGFVPRAPRHTDANKQGMYTATTRPTRREQHTTQQSNTKWAPRKKEKTTITNRHDLNGGRNSAGESGSLLVGHGLGGPFHSCRCFVSDSLAASSGPVEVFSSGDAFSLAPHGSLVRFAFPLSPLFLRMGSGHALDHFGLVSLP